LPFFEVKKQQNLQMNQPDSGVIEQVYYILFENYFQQNLQKISKRWHITFYMRQRQFINRPSGFLFSKSRYKKSAARRIMTHNGIFKLGEA
jgi:hypothetical protein